MSLEYKMTNVIPDPPTSDPNDPEFHRWVYENFLHIQQCALRGVTGVVIVGDKILTLREGLIIDVEEVS